MVADTYVLGPTTDYKTLGVSSRYIVLCFHELLFAKISFFCWQFCDWPCYFDF